MQKKRYKPSLILSSILVLTVCSFAAITSGQDNEQLRSEQLSSEQLSSKQQCDKVINEVARKKGKNYGANPCSSNSYPAEFWQCVEQEIDTFDLSMSIYFCEQKLGFK